MKKTGWILASVTAAVLALGLAGWIHHHARPAVTVRTLSLKGAGSALVGDLYLPGPGEKAPIAILFLHGSTPLGRRLALYPALCERLAARGYVVLNLDQRGYGESEKLSKVCSLADLDYVADARAIARQLPGLAGRPVRETVLVGHSFGGGVSAAAGFAEPEVKRVISISPGRRLSTRFPDKRPDLLAYVQQRRSAELHLTEPIPIELIFPLLSSYNIEQWQGKQLSKPFLMIEGAKEPEDDLAFSRTLIEKMTGEVVHVILPGCDHYFGTRITQNGAEKKWTITQEDRVNALVDTIDRWLRGCLQPPRS